ncbi:MAG: hypothetical protein JNJ85_01800, partial [Candidatus Kapabacteria bacterium]|nr:hypothetical protein [Candidatus Kapabacteria bacterium]
VGGFGGNIDYSLFTDNEFNVQCIHNVCSGYYDWGPSDDLVPSPSNLTFLIQDHTLKFRLLDDVCGSFTLKVLATNIQLGLIDEDAFDITVPCTFTGREFCMRWVPRSSTVDPVDIRVPRLNCESQATQTLLSNIEQAIREKVTAVNKNATIAYNTKCRAFDKTKSELIVHLPTTEVTNFTLYYYNRGGNIMKTVPPEGFREVTVPAGSTQSLSRDNSEVNHSLITTYEYGLLGNLISKKSPDEDKPTLFFYDKQLRPRYTILPQDYEYFPIHYQTHTEWELRADKFNYTRYDDLGRIAEVGRVKRTSKQPLGGYLSYINMNSSTFPNPLTLVATTLDDRTKYTYADFDGSANPPYPEQITYLQQAPDDPIKPTNTPQNLRNRLVKVERENSVTTNGMDNSAITYFSYDNHGNVDWVQQRLPGFAQPGWNTPAGWGSHDIRADVDYFSGNIHQVYYNEFRSDGFYQKYEYDADNRLTKTLSSRNAFTQVNNAGTPEKYAGGIFDIDARYYYYPHGPLRRKEIGQDKVQGIDYTYTLSGQVKAVNHRNSPNYPMDDPGQDGYTGNPLNAQIPRDVFGQELYYYINDFNRTKFGSPVFYSDFASGAYDIHSGFITASISNFYSTNGAFTKNFGNGNTVTLQNLDTRAERYKYDIAGKLVATNGYLPDNGEFQYDNTNAFNTQYKYDLNGNLSELNRNDHNGTEFDNFTYNYNTTGSGQSYQLTNNRLQFVTDPVADVANKNDLDMQRPGNYMYNKNGQLVYDRSMPVIDWDVANVAGAGTQTIFYDSYNKLQKQYQQWISKREVNTPNERWELW